MTTTAHKWGGSTGVRIPQHLAKKYNITPGTKIEMSDDGEKIVLIPKQDKPTLENWLNTALQKITMKKLISAAQSERNLYKCRYLHNTPSKKLTEETLF